MVRLKAWLTTTTRPTKRYFNSTMVRLKANLSGSEKLRELNFNSTMVRLKDGCEGLGIYWCIIFQFHYGSVKSIKGRISPSQVYAFQFHYGSVKSEVMRSIKSKQVVFQFHYGSVKRQVNGRTFWREKRISIPLWFG